MVGQGAWIAVYIVASARNGTLYTGVTSQLPGRVQQHKLGTFDGFTSQYGCKTLVWYEDHPFMSEATTERSRSSVGGAPGSWR
jgi:putative endonuclease